MTTPRHVLFAALTLLGAAALPAMAHRGGPGFEAARDKAFAEADVDGNGALSSDEFAAFHQALRHAFEAARFAKIDTNGDGQLSLEELAAAPPPHRPCGPAAE